MEQVVAKNPSRPSALRQQDGRNNRSCAMEFVIGFLIGASLGCSFGYVLSAITRTAKEADIILANLRSAQHEREREPELPLAA
jgi:hypothetical protein